MSSINYDLSKIKAFVFDIDGVLSPNIIPMDIYGYPIRMLNVKDRYAIRRALKQGFSISIITGANTDAVRIYYKQLGIEYLYTGSQNKVSDLKEFSEKVGVAFANIMYSGDDIPDLEAMKMVGLPVAPADAAYEIRNIAKYISVNRGGEGVARDVIEQVLRAQDKWL